MQGTVVMVMRIGVRANLDGTPTIGDPFQIYRVVDGVETPIGTGYVRKPVGEGCFKINPPDTEEDGRGHQFPDVQVGDLVRSVFEPV